MGTSYHSGCKRKDVVPFMAVVVGGTPSLISLMESVDIKHHVYLLISHRLSDVTRSNNKGQYDRGLCRW